MDVGRDEPWLVLDHHVRGFGPRVNQALLMRWRHSERILRSCHPTSAGQLIPGGRMCSLALIPRAWRCSDFEHRTDAIVHLHNYISPAPPPVSCANALDTFPARVWAGPRRARSVPSLADRTSPGDRRADTLQILAPVARNPHCANSHMVQFWQVIAGGTVAAHSALHMQRGNHREFSGRDGQAPSSGSGYSALDSAQDLHHCARDDAHNSGRSRYPIYAPSQMPHWLTWWPEKRKELCDD
jgi:hypothetical protein